MKGVVPYTIYVYVYVLRFGFEVLFIMFAKSPPVITSPSWELDFFH